MCFGQPPSMTQAYFLHRHACLVLHTVPTVGTVGTVGTVVLAGTMVRYRRYSMMLVHNACIRYRTVGTAGTGTALCTTRPTRLIFRVSTHAAELHARGGDGSIRLGLGPGVRVYTSAGLGSSNDSPLIRIGSVRTDFGCQNAIVSPSAS